MSGASPVERFRARFAGIAAQERAERRAAHPTPDDRLRAALDLDAFNLILSLDKARQHLRADDRAAILAEVNRRRLAAAPMPSPLCKRRRASADDGQARSR